MQELIEKIFAEHDFAEAQRKDNSYFYSKKSDNDIEYFLVDFIDAEDLKGYIEGDKASNIFTLFEENRNKKNDVEKNTSLILCVKVDNIKTGIHAIKNDILAIEENDYWFKKYTIVYTDNALPAPNTETDIIEQLNKQILDSGVFQVYKDNIYVNEQYFLTIQLYLKLPFLIVPTQSQVNYRTISEILALKLTGDDIELQEKIKDLEDIDSTEFWDTLKSSVLDTTASDDFMQQFINKFSTDAEA